ncbi:MAG: peptide ABC transporter substrate-binding protein [Gemmatimonadota bacterium]
MNMLRDRLLPWRPLARVLQALLALTGVAACGDGGRAAADRNGRGTIIIGVAADADFLLPAVVGQLVGKQVFDQIYDPLAVAPASLRTVGDAGFEPRLATSWTWSPDSLSIAFALDPRARWHDGIPVRSTDVRFSVSLIKDPVVLSSLAGGLSNVDSVSTPDSLTAVVWFARRTPEQFFVLVNSLAVMPEHLLSAVPRDALRESEASRHPVGSGRFRFRRWVRGARIELVADTANYRGRPGVDHVVWSVSPDPTSLWARLVAGEVDLVEVLMGESLQNVIASTTARVVPYNSLDYAYLTFNLSAPGNPRRAHPILGDQGVRRALAMATDRATIVRNVFDTLAFVGSGPFVRAQWTADTSVATVGFDREGAQALLDSLGWRDTNGDGIREKGGRPLALSLLYPSSSNARRRSAPLLQAQWKAVGVDLRLEDMEVNTYTAQRSGGKFDVAFDGSHADPSPAEIRQNWGSKGHEGAGTANFGGYANPKVDALFDSALTTFDTERSRLLYRRAYEQINADVPAIFLYEPRLVAGLSRRINAGTWRNDGWWTTLADWTIAPADRIPRDRIPLSADLGPDSSRGDSVGASK